MSKFGSKKDLEEVSISDEMVRECKKDIAQYGFEGEDYNQFLVSVQAMNEEGSVLQYPNKDLSIYRERYLKKNEKSIGDQFILDKFKIKSSNGEKQYETGYFAPRSFWDKIRFSKVDFKTK